jgi:hypothetical protein
MRGAYPRPSRSYNRPTCSHREQLALSHSGQAAQDSSKIAALFRANRKRKLTAAHAALALLFARANLIKIGHVDRPADQNARGRYNAKRLIRQACLAPAACSEFQFAIAKGSSPGAGGVNLPASQAPSTATIQEHEVQTGAIPESSLVQVNLVPDRSSRGPLGSIYRCGIHGSSLAHFEGKNRLSTCARSGRRIVSSVIHSAWK